LERLLKWTKISIQRLAYNKFCPICGGSITLKCVDLHPDFNNDLAVRVSCNNAACGLFNANKEPTISPGVKTNGIKRPSDNRKHTLKFRNLTDMFPVEMG
jgi:hypothetical protein